MIGQVLCELWFSFQHYSSCTSTGFDLEYDSFGLRMKGLDVGSVGG